MIIWKGRSQLDGQPIVLIATGLKNKSNNPKIGAMVQTWILVDGLHPQEALKTGADESICGNCVHRGEAGKNRTCYVRMHGPAAVWRAYQAGSYVDVSNDLQQAQAAVAGRIVRLGAYGDPAAVPSEVWRTLLANVKGHTGYTHQWRTCDQILRDFCMASVDSLQEMSEAVRKGWRTFRVRSSETSLSKGEIVCPAAEEAGKRTTCEKCRLCNGKPNDADARKNIAIVVHGIGKRNLRIP